MSKMFLAIAFSTLLSCNSAMASGASFEIKGNAGLKGVELTTGTKISASAVLATKLAVKAGKMALKLGKKAVSAAVNTVK